MSQHFDWAGYHILIGGEDIIDHHLHAIQCEGPEDADKTAKAHKKLLYILKEMRVRIGTMLKTDNVSFLFGAGASIDAGGFSLANIPKPLEKALIERAKSEKTGGQVPGWIELFYKSTSMLTQDKHSFETRSTLYGSPQKKDIPAIAINLEDYLSHLYLWLAGMIQDTETLMLSGDVKISINKIDIKKLIKEIKSVYTGLLDLPKAGLEDPLRSHRKFIKKILTRPLNLRRANIFTLNNDTLIEQAADAEGSVLVDGFVGTLRRIFRPESYEIDFYFPAQTTEGRVHRFDRALHLYKLHGSIIWHRCEPDWENPYGLFATFYDQNIQDDDVLIYPTPLKFGETLGMPYSELFRRLGNTIGQPQSVLFVIGYGFGDDHVNALIRQALAIPSFTLVVVDPEPKSDFVRKLEGLKDERVWIIKGWELGTFNSFIEKLLPDLREEEINAKVMHTFKELSQVSD